MPLITFLTIIRNDDYYVDFKERVQKTLDLNLKSLQNLKLLNSVEFLFVDWGSVKPLSDCIMVEKKFRKNVNFININESVAKKNSSPKTNYFNHSLAWNIGLKKSNSKYIIISGSDQFFDENSWQNLINLCNRTNPRNKNYYLIPRKIIDFNLYKKLISADQLLNLISNFSSSLYPFKSHAYYYGGGFAILCSKINYFKLKGMIETQDPGVANDFDLSLRSISNNFKKFNLANSIFSYKFPPLPDSNRNKLIYSKEYRKLPMLNINYNPSRWGKVAEKIKISKPKITDKSMKLRNFSPLKITNTGYLNIFKILKNLDYFFTQISDLKKIFIILKIIEETDIITFIEIGYNNHSRIDIIGSYHKYLNILCYDKDFKNKNYGYLDRLYKSSRFFNKARYGKYVPLVNINIKKALEIINSNYTLDLTNLLILNKLDKNTIYILNNIKFFSSIKFLILFSFSEKEKNFVKNKFFSKSKEVKLDNENFVLINEKNLDNKNLININQRIEYEYKRSYFLGYTKFIFYFILIKILNFMRYIFYSI